MDRQSSARHDALPASQFAELEPLGESVPARNRAYRIFALAAPRVQHSGLNQEPPDGLDYALEAPGLEPKPKPIPSPSTAPRKGGSAFQTASYMT